MRFKGSSLINPIYPKKKVAGNEIKIRKTNKRNRTAVGGRTRGGGGDFVYHAVMHTVHAMVTLYAQEY